MLILLKKVFQECDPAVQRHRVLVFILVFIGFGILMLFAFTFQNFLFACSGEALTKRLRSKTFRTLLRQEVAYFDNPKNNTGALCTRLATEASAVQGATGIRIGTMLQTLSALGGGIIISFVFSWQLTLLILAFVPFMVAGGFLQTRLMSGFASKDKETFEDAGKV
jgi:ABC-type multidrug transport system fused ATPase/permease subunit